MKSYCFFKTIAERFKNYKLRSENLLGFSSNQKNTQFIAFVISIRKVLKMVLLIPFVIVDPNDNNRNDNTASISKGKEFWIRNDLYNLKKQDTDILHSQSAWLNDHIMDAAQKLICKTLGDERSCHSVLNTERKVSILFRPVNHDHIQLLHNDG